MSKVKIVGHGAKAELWVDNHMIGHNVEAYVFTHEGGQRPRLAVSYIVDDYEIEADDVTVTKEGEAG